jgi:hypothetical protein
MSELERIGEKLLLLDDYAIIGQSGIQSTVA